MEYQTSLANGYLGDTMSDLSDLPANTELATAVRFALTQWAEPKTTKLKQILFAFAAPAFAANGWLAAHELLGRPWESHPG